MRIFFVSDRDQAFSNSQAHCFSPAACVQLAKNGTDVEFGGMLGDRQTNSNLFVAQPHANKAKDLGFTSGQVFHLSSWTMPWWERYSLLILLISAISLFCSSP